MKYNWTHLTTLMMFTDLPTNLMCHAHSLGVGASHALACYSVGAVLCLLVIVDEVFPPPPLFNVIMASHTSPICNVN